MPQINYYTYLSQCTWTIILFYTFYYIMKQYFIPLLFESFFIINSTNPTTSLQTLNTNPYNFLI